jgi:hypothetical protein
MDDEEFVERASLIEQRLRFLFTISMIIFIVAGSVIGYKIGQAHPSDDEFVSSERYFEQVAKYQRVVSGLYYTCEGEFSLCNETALEDNALRYCAHVDKNIATNESFTYLMECDGRICYTIMRGDLVE